VLQEGSVRNRNLPGRAITQPSGPPSAKFCQNRVRLWENLSDMKTYPRLTIRLSTTEMQRLRMLSRARNQSCGKILWHALDLYFRSLNDFEPQQALPRAHGWRLAPRPAASDATPSTVASFNSTSSTSSGAQARARFLVASSSNFAMGSSREWTSISTAPRSPRSARDRRSRSLRTSEGSPSPLSGRWCG
jgi:hypothetical protein